ncbi:zinc finger, CCHC-type containing protein [Tanacetum coccineum]
MNNSGFSSNKKPKLECWKCGKTGHFKRDCRSGKRNNANVGDSGKGSKDQSQDQCQNLVDAIAWWIDFGAIAIQTKADVDVWKEAIDDEIGSIMENNTWDLSDLPSGCKHLGCKWIFKRKMKFDGTIDKFKTRLVIQGFRQQEGIDYFNTYAPVARITTIRLLLALVAIHNLVIHQMDVKIEFLNGDLEEEMYMKQLKRFVMPGNEHKVCKLVKSLKFDGSGKGVIFCLYVDDILIFGTNQNQVDKTKRFLSSMKDIGEVDVILGIKIKRENKEIVITQSYYIEKILKKFNCKDCSLVYISMDLVENLMPNIGKPVGQLEYSRAIGCMMYALTSSRRVLDLILLM